MKQQAKSISAGVPHLVPELGGGAAGRRRTLAALALLVPLRAHKPSGGTRPVRWRRLLAEALPAALQAARDAEQGDRDAEQRDRLTEAEGTEKTEEREAAWEMLAAVCAAREHLKTDLPSTYVMVSSTEVAIDSAES